MQLFMVFNNLQGRKETVSLLLNTFASKMPVT